MVYSSLSFIVVDPALPEPKCACVGGGVTISLCKISSQPTWYMMLFYPTAKHARESRNISPSAVILNLNGKAVSFF